MNNTYVILILLEQMLAKPLTIGMAILVSIGDPWHGPTPQWLFQWDLTVELL